MQQRRDRGERLGGAGLWKESMGCVGNESGAISCTGPQVYGEESLRECVGEVTSG